MMEMRIFQKGFNYSQDGPGNRLVYHLQGCNMHCPWCSNPEGIDIKGSVMIKEGFNEEICMRKAVQNGVFDSRVCTGCDRDCLKMNHLCVSLSCSAYFLEELTDEIMRSKAMFFDGGGVTFTGGEPTLQLPSLLKVCKALKEKDINIAIETNCSHPELTSLLPYVDDLMADFKHYDDEKHRHVTGISNAIIKKNLKKCSDICPVHIRIPLIGGFNDGKDDAKNFAETVSKFNTGNITVEFLTFHEYGKTKWAQCGKPYIMTGNEYINNDTKKYFIETFRKYGIKTVNT